jgi:hypothetical protein
MVSPSQRRHAVRSVVAAGVCSLRQACRHGREFPTIPHAELIMP